MATPAGAPLFEGEYDHLNDEPIPLTLDWDELADLIVNQNYGMIRFLAALVRARQRSERLKGYPDELVEGIITLLKLGLH
jgi:hypothetical protein